MPSSRRQFMKVSAGAVVAVLPDRTPTLQALHSLTKESQLFESTRHQVGEVADRER